MEGKAKSVAVVFFFLRSGVVFFWREPRLDADPGEEEEEEGEEDVRHFFKF
jgi:hypothetical protein